MRKRYNFDIDDRDAVAELDRQWSETGADPE
jgi:hypothetical protein